MQRYPAFLGPRDGRGGSTSPTPSPKNIEMMSYLSCLLFLFLFLHFFLFLLSFFLPSSLIILSFFCRSFFLLLFFCCCMCGTIGGTCPKATSYVQAIVLDSHAGSAEFDACSLLASFIQGVKMFTRFCSSRPGVLKGVPSYP